MSTLDHIAGKEDQSLQIEPSKTCIRCGETLPADSFHRYGQGRGRRAICRQCRSETRKSRQETPAQRLARKLRDEYSLTIAQYAAIAEAQGGLCAICDRAPAAGTRLYVDHCHATGVVRALLCNPCNLMIGVYENNRQIAAEYLAAYAAGNPLLKR